MTKLVKPWQKDRKAEIEAMATFRQALLDKDVSGGLQTDGKAFCDMLINAERRGYVHYTRLTAAMGLKDASSVSRWFKGKVAPDRFRRVFAIAALEKIIANDIRRMSEEPPQDPIGHKSMKEHPELGIEVPDLVA